MTTLTSVVTPPRATAMVTTAAADGNARLTNMFGSNDYAGRQGRGVEQNDRNASHLDWQTNAYVLR